MYIVHNLAVSIIGSLGLLFTGIWWILYPPYMSTCLNVLISLGCWYIILLYSLTSKRISRTAVEFRARMSNFICSTFIPTHNNKVEVEDTVMLSYCPTFYQSVIGIMSPPQFCHILIASQLDNPRSYIINSRLDKFQSSIRGLCIKWILGFYCCDLNTKGGCRGSSSTRCSKNCVVLVV